MSGLKPGGRILRVILSIAWITGVAWATLTPGQEAATSASAPSFSTCIFCQGTETADVLRNLVGFVPLGLLLGTTFRPLTALALGVLVSAGIEITQIWIPGRFPGLGDIFWNGLGAALGALAVSPLRRWLQAGTPTAARVVALGLPCVIVSMLGLLMLPVRFNLPYFGQWTPEGLILEPYGGRVVQASLNDIPVPDGPFPADSRPDLALAGDWVLSVTMTKGPVPASPSTVVRLHADIGIFYLAVNHGDLVWHQRTWGQRLGFNSADPQFAGALDGFSEGEVLTVGVRREGERLCLLAADRASCNHGVSPAQTWVLLAGPRIRAATPQTRTDFLWMGFLFLAAGLLGGRRRSTLLMALAGAAGLGLATWLTPLASPGLIDFTGMLIGIAAGVLLRPILRRLLGVPPAARVASGNPA